MTTYKKKDIDVKVVNHLKDPDKIILIYQRK